MAAANAVTEPLRGSGLEVHHLRAVQRRRELPVRIIQRLQSIAQQRVGVQAVNSGGLPSPPAPVRGAPATAGGARSPGQHNRLRHLARASKPLGRATMWSGSSARRRKKGKAADDRRVRRETLEVLADKMGGRAGPAHRRRHAGQRGRMMTTRPRRRRFPVCSGAGTGVGGR